MVLMSILILFLLLYGIHKYLHFLLIAGDRVKLLFLNSAGSRGFGWVKHSSLSFKKWGFFQVSDLVPKHTGKNSTLGGASDLPLINRL